VCFSEISALIPKIARRPCSCRCHRLVSHGKNYLDRIRKALPYVPPIPVAKIKALHRTAIGEGKVMGYGDEFFEDDEVDEAMEALTRIFSDPKLAAKSAFPLQRGRTNSISVSEHVVMMILSLVRNYIPSYQWVINGGWNIADCVSRS
jgi:hypothetical protein